MVRIFLFPLLHINHPTQRKKLCISMCAFCNRINLSRNNSFNRHLHHQQQQPVSSVYGGSSHYAEPVYAEPPMTTTYNSSNLAANQTMNLAGNSSNLAPNQTMNMAGMGAAGMMGATSPGVGRIKSSPPFTQVENIFATSYIIYFK